MYISFLLKLKQLHAVHNSVKTAYLGKIWFSNYGPKWYYSIRFFKYEYLKIGWTDWADFFLRSKVIQRNTMNAEWFHIPARACACVHFSPRIFLPFFCWILIDVYNFLLKIVLHNGPRGSAKTACPGKSYFLSYSWKCYQSMKSCMML